MHLSIFYARSLINTPISAVSCLKPDIPHGRVGEPGLIEPGDEVGIECDPNYRLSTSSRVICVSGEVYSTGHVEGIHTFPMCTREYLVHSVALGLSQMIRNDPNPAS